MLSGCTVLTLNFLVATKAAGIKVFKMVLIFGAQVIRFMGDD